MVKHLVIYVHGKGGNANEAEHYKPFFAESDVIGFDYQAQNPWEAQKEFSSFFEVHSQGYDSVTLIANSIGAFFSMSALTKKQVAQAILISPVVNMEKLIVDMMMWANVTEEELRIKKEILTEFGEKDNLTSIETISEFAGRIGASLTVMKDGEHWFHTEQQMEFLDDWLRNIKEIKTGLNILRFGREYDDKISAGVHLNDALPLFTLNIYYFVSCFCFLKNSNIHMPAQTIRIPIHTTGWLLSPVFGEDGSVGFVGSDGVADSFFVMVNVSSPSVLPSVY